ncbi:carotenoid biosynthesis protein [Rugosimonospora africana]|uniref:Membrane protein n=1 Tax=Rugosimonospora africana TaxID=556532 RepID=A0A8J3R1V2_9ACTN|nr:carotenoid biosynthesis protein [Rugosimonospora africana]GIH18666.1 membrane protein [Rugosimonospora africana]
MRAADRVRAAGPVPGARSTAGTGAARWLPLGGLIVVQIGYPITHGGARTGLVMATVLIGFAGSVGHALATRGPRTAAALVAVTGAGGLAVEALGVRTGFPFGGYGYSASLGPRLLGVPLVVPLAWTWMAWPAWLAATSLVGRGAARLGVARLGVARWGVARVAVAGLGLAAWDLFLDPQMVADGYWSWRHPEPGLAGIPYTNYLGWLGVAVAMMALFAGTAGSRARIADRRADAPMLALYLWTYLSSALAHAAFLHLPVSAAAGAIGMGLVAIPLAIALC